MQMVRVWRKRWAEATDRLRVAQGDEKELQRCIDDVLADLYRSGTPATFSAEQIVHIVAVGCEEPEQSGRPVIHWTPTELADEVVKRGIVKTISSRSVGRF